MITLDRGGNRLLPTYILIISIIFTIVVLALSILTISKGYGYKHKIDPPVDPSEHQYEKKPNE